MRWAHLLWLGLSACFDFSDDNNRGGGGGTRPDANLVDACVPRTCAVAGASCGSIEDGCGGTLECGTCEGLATCAGQGVDNVCAIPAADRVCSEDWCWEGPAPFPFMPTAIATVSMTDVWAVGARGTVLHYDGMHWRPVDAGTTADLHDVWMASSTDGWLVGAGGVIRRWNGTAWNPVSSGTTADLMGVWGSAATNVWIVGTNVARRWNGSSLLVGPVTTPALRDVFIAGSTVFAVGEGRVWELVAGTWTARTGDSPLFTSYALNDIGGTATSVYALGRRSSFGSGEDLGYHWDGSAWTPYTDEGDPEWTAVYADANVVYGASDQSIANLATVERVQGPGGRMVAATSVLGQAFVATLPRDTSQLFTGHGGTWTASASFGARFELSHVAVVGHSVWFGGVDGVTEWRGGPIEHQVPTTQPIAGIGGTARDDVWATTRSDTFHFDGAGWTRISNPGFIEPATLVMLDGDPVLVGRGVQRRVGDAWVDLAGGSSYRFASGVALDGELYVAGTTTLSPYTPHVMRTVQGTFSELPAPQMQQACGIAVAGPDDIWVTGFTEVGTGIDKVTDGVIAHWNGTTWSTETRAGAGKLCAVELHDGALYVSGVNTALHRRAANGTWTTSYPLRAGSVRALRAQGTTLWAVGDHGAVLRSE